MGTGGKARVAFTGLFLGPLTVDATRLSEESVETLGTGYFDRKLDEVLRFFPDTSEDEVARRWGSLSTEEMTKIGLLSGVPLVFFSKRGRVFWAVPKCFASFDRNGDPVLGYADSSGRKGMPHVSGSS